MSAAAPAANDGFAVEATPIGAQSLVPGVVPITPRDRLQWRAEAPLAPTRQQRPCDLGLFDVNARNQLDLFAQLSPPDPDSAKSDRSVAAAEGSII